MLAISGGGIILLGFVIMVAIAIGAVVVLARMK
jgi:hypothetical protein